jgi:hypothetical protein
VHGGIETIVHLSRAMLESYISRPLAAGQAPSHAFCFLDIENMFNAISRETVRRELDRHDAFRCLLPLFDLLYDQPNACWFRTPSSAWDSFQQFEGFAQGCPLSPCFAALAFFVILLQINKETAQRTTARGQPRTDSLSYHDDTQHPLRYADILWYLRRFHEIGSPHGVRLNFTKTYLLTSTTGSSPLPLLSPADQQALQDALDFLSSHGNPSPERTGGVRLLGRPLGGSPFVTSYLRDASSTFHTDILRLHAGIADLHTRASLFRFCTRATVDHLLDSDFYEHASLARPSSPTAWSSSFSDSIHAQTVSFFSHLLFFSPPPPAASNTTTGADDPPSADTPADDDDPPPSANAPSNDNAPPPRHATASTAPPFPPHAIDQLYRPSSLGGVGIRSPYITASTSFVIPIARSIRLADNGISLPSSGDSPSHLPRSHRSILRSWNSSDLRLFRLFRHYGKSILSYRFPDDPSAQDLSTLTSSHLNLQGFQRDFARLYHRNQLAAVANHPLTFTNSPSLTAPWMSLALHSLSRQHKDHRYDNDIYRLALLRRLRLPLLPSELHDTVCTCGKPLDPFGDHIFSCSHVHKGALSNALRDTLATLFRVLAPLAAFTPSADCVSIETPQLSPSSLRKRPADVGMHLSPSYLPKPSPKRARFLAVDVTVPPPPPSTADAPFTAATATSQHQRYETKKFAVSGTDPRIAVLDDLVNQQMLLLPFTVDHLGGIGPLAHRLLFGPDPTRAPDPPPSSFPTGRSSLYLYDMAYSPLAPSNLFKRADDNWTTLNPFQRYGPSYHTSLPSHWGQQFLGLNFTALLTNHLQAGIARLLAHHRNARLSASARRNLYNPIGSIFTRRTYASRVRTMRTASDL